MEIGRMLSFSRNPILASLLSRCAIAAFVLTAVAHIRAQAPDQPGIVSVQPCEVPEVAGGGRCGTYEVFENRSIKTGRKISLNVVVIPALSTPAAPDPVFWLEGGPGGAATQAVGPVSQNYLLGLRNDHDLVFVDERGTGKSNPLKCDDIGEDPSNLDAYFGKLFPPN